MRDLFSASFALFRETIARAAANLLAGRTRTILTTAIMAIGIMCLVAIETALSSLSKSLGGFFGELGSGNCFVMPEQNEESLPLSEAEARGIASFLAGKYPSAIIGDALSGVEATFGKRKSDPTLSLKGVDGDFQSILGVSVESGRTLSSRELAAGGDVCLIGHDVGKSLFGDLSDAVGSVIVVDELRLTVVGVLAESGDISGDSPDSAILVPMRLISAMHPELRVGFSLPEGVLIETAKSELRPAIRDIRRLRPRDKDNFRFVQNDGAARAFDKLSRILSLAAFVIGLITISGAAVGLMNTMLVSVKERTREIGICKAIGASPSTIRLQFLAESVIIGLSGGFAGLILGLTAGNATALVLGSGFCIPWKWIWISLFTTFSVSLLSGSLPARRAAALDPIESLSYE